MNWFALTLVLPLWTSCSKSHGDDCRRFATKAMPTVTELRKEAGAPFESKASADAVAESLVAACRKAAASSTQDPAVSCVLHAEHRAAIRACLEDEFEKPSERRLPEAKVQLDKIAKAAKELYIANGEFTKGTAPLTPAVSCCIQDFGKKRKCSPFAGEWLSAVWQTLDFKMEEPFYFQYSYTSDGRQLEVKAIADLDCDGNTIEYVLRGSAVDGDVTFRIIEPPANTD